MVGSRTTSSVTIVVLVAAALATGGCGRSEVAQATSRIGFCQGVDADHREGSTHSVEFRRGTTILGTITLQTRSAGSIPVAPGDAVVYLDGVEVAQLMTTDGTTAYARAGTGCPDSIT